MLFSSTLFLAILGGILPALLWLWFWLHEDNEHPEPRFLIALCFLLGMVAVLLVLPIEGFIFNHVSSSVTTLFFLWAFSEELIKYGAAYLGGLRSKANDEPIDPIIYLLATALGFAALENTLFLVDPLIRGNIIESIVTGNLRFIGASLLHVVSSATIGVFLAFSFYKPRFTKIIYSLIGFTLATILHTAFNLFIISNSDGSTFLTLATTWIFIAILILSFEQVKTVGK